MPRIASSSAPAAGEAVTTIDANVHACPKCGYVRKPADTAPDWQCPGCGIVYAKFGAVPHGHAHSFEPGEAARASPSEHLIAPAAKPPVINTAGDDPAYLPKNIIPLKTQIGHTLMAVFLLGYGAYGAVVDEIIIPGKRSTLILHGWSVWVVYAAMICAALVLLSVVVDNYDPRDDERYYHIFAHVFQTLGWGLFLVAIIAPIFVESLPRELAKAKPLALQGDASAEFTLGLAYANGEGVRRNYGEAMSWYQMAAKQGEPRAMNNIGIMYFHGQGVKRDYDQAAVWYRRAAQAGHARAQNNLGLMYYNLQIQPKDYEQGVEWFRKSAEQGYFRGLYNLARSYERGKGVEQDWTQAHMLYELAGAAGFEGAGERATALEPQMTPDDIAQAKALAQAWRRTHDFSN